MATTTFAVVQLGWIPATESRVAGLTALLAAAPLQLVASVLGFLTRDPVAATGMGMQAGTWALLGAVTVTSPPGSTSPGLGVLLVTAGVAVLVPSVVGNAKVAAAAAAAMGASAARFAVTGIYEVTAEPAWQTACSTPTRWPANPGVRSRL